MKLDLHGQWRFDLDSHGEGVKERWFARDLRASISLPGSTDEHGYGEKSEDVDTFRLNRKFKYIGEAWYQRDVIIPEAWRGKRVTLFLERCLWATDVWIDDCYVGKEDSLSTPHVHDLRSLLTPGVHRLTIKVDNRPQVNLGTWSHGWSEEVQTIWNGIIGRIELRATDPVYIDSVQVYPDIHKRHALVRVIMWNHTGQVARGRLSFQAKLKVEDDEQSALAPVAVDFTSLAEGETRVEVEYLLGEQAKFWDEFSPWLYTLTVEMTANVVKDAYAHESTVDFGLRDFSARGPQFEWNGAKVLLRGTHEAGNFPLTGYPSTDKAEWLRIYRIGKSYGLNHFRFHSWCPPEAAFEAADEEGIILQAELPLFSNSAPLVGSDSPRDAFLRRELVRILTAYGNHPSFCLMCMGNELSGDYRVLKELVMEGRALDPRHLYTSSANNAAEPSIGIRPYEGDEFYVAHEARVNGERIVRRCELTFNEARPETTSDYGFTLDGIDIPTVSHEVGQWMVYPDYREVAKYTGTLQARNLEAFRQSLESKGMLDQAEDFMKASGALSVLLYREEIEKSLRTPGYGGFQLLDIHDYPGQGTALVGWLDAFWDSKGLIDPEQFRRFCAPVILLLRMPTRVFTTNEWFTADVDVSNYSLNTLHDITVIWTVKHAMSGDILATGEFEQKNVLQGELARVGGISIALDPLEHAQKMNVEVSLKGMDIVNDWDFWVYPEPASLSVEGIPDDIVIADEWDDAVEQHLHAGGKVLMMSGNNVRKSESVRFTPPFWNTQLFPYQPKSMGLLCQADHPALAFFPTESHTNWQWWGLFVHATAIEMNGTPQDLRPIVQAIDHPVRNHKLGMLFEARVGAGKLIVSGFDLTKDIACPVTQQLRYSLLCYMQSDAFEPAAELSVDVLRDALLSKLPNRLASQGATLTASSQHWTGGVYHILNGNNDQFWLSDEGNAYPHEVVIRLEEPVPITGFRYNPRQDGNETGWVQDYEWYVSMDGVHWGDPVAEGSFERCAIEQCIPLGWHHDGFNVTRTVAGQYIRFVARSGFDGDDRASACEMDIYTV
ncbi:sugar-binding domain-containing protein [Paenibacillus guangzhouensis]|uniref:sugar-binding domain-containing protein n=1 Tax=Paenibacillus guangzhouensis TaxID=1473112 RepID=UPI00126726F4|nr:sugar-binding domain-containing protein [Paenibacillus guangzhouensis]